MFPKVFVGDRFGRLVVLSRLGRQEKYALLCQCDCGGTSKVRGDSLLRGSSQSCGCIHREAASAQGRRNTKHGGARRLAQRDLAYHSWCGMKARCYNPFDHKFEHYGGRGITVCPQWRYSYATFLKDMGHRTSTRLSLDRIDVDGNYEPENCRWATQKTQQNNRRNTGLNLRRFKEAA